MKQHLFKLAALAFFAATLTAAAVAQDDATMFRANIPVDFYVGDKLMPAGEYQISVDLREHELAIEEKATGHTSFLLGSPDDGSRDDRTVLTFKLVAGDVYALRELQAPDLGLSFRAKAPQITAKAQNHGKETITVVAEAR